jgi:hypothetical protein
MRSAERDQAQDGPTGLTAGGDRKLSAKGTVAELCAQGHGDRHIARVLGLTRHQARKAIREAEKQAAHSEILLPDPAPGAPAQAWAERITESWRQSVRAILEAGRLLMRAKAALPHGEFGPMIEKELPFSAQTAQKLMAIAGDPKLSNPAHVRLLPPSWGTLYELHRLPDDDFARGIESGAIHADMERKQISAFIADRHHPSGDLDFAPTGPWITRALIQKVLPQIPDIHFAIAEQTAWECACGEGHMAEVLAEYFGRVLASDVHDYGYGQVLDFLADESRPSGADEPDWIITNSPFDDKIEAFFHKAWSIARVGVCLLTQMRWIETPGRYERLFSKYLPTLYAVFAERAPLHMGRWDPDGKTLTAYSWIVWVKDLIPKGPLFSAMLIPPGQRQALERRGDRERFTAHPVIRREAFEKRQKAAKEDDPTVLEAISGDEELKILEVAASGQTAWSSERAEQLKADCLIAGTDKWLLTKKGRERLHQLRERALLAASQPVRLSGEPDGSPAAEPAGGA